MLNAEAVAPWLVGVGAVAVTWALLKINFFESAKEKLIEKLDETMPEVISGLNAIKTQQLTAIEDFFVDEVNLAKDSLLSFFAHDDSSNGDAAPTATTSAPTVTGGGDPTPAVTDVNTKNDKAKYYGCTQDDIDKGHCVMTS